ncbi:MAG: hypothetical protein HYX60_06965 [Legionella longbeachae]|nr:hypothetical protein [Legionella longbeachae]
MEQDRFEVNHKLYILGMICLVLCLGLFFFSFYILPYLIWELDYNVPLVILNLLAVLQEDYNYSVGASKVIVWLIFFLPSLITGIISYFVSNYIDNKLYVEPPVNENKESLPPKEIGKEVKESVALGFKILGLMIVIIIILFLLQFCAQNTA